MNVSMEDNDLVNVAMQIILNAGDARVLADEAVGFAKKYEFAEAKRALAEAHKKIVAAHQSQTKVIQDETRGVEHEINLLFIHAQDTLMTIASEVRITKSMVELFELTQNK